MGETLEMKWYEDASDSGESDVASDSGEILGLEREPHLSAIVENGVRCAAARTKVY